jgi:hypothetical protein
MFEERTSRLAKASLMGWLFGWVAREFCVHCRRASSSVRIRSWPAQFRTAFVRGGFRPPCATFFRENPAERLRCRWRSARWIRGYFSKPRRSSIRLNRSRSPEFISTAMWLYGRRLLGR